MPGLLPDDFAIQTLATSDRSVRVSVRGELDVETAPALDDVLAREMCAERAVVLDFAGTTFMDSNGLTVLVRAISDAKVNGWDLSVTPDIHANVKRILELTAVLPLLPILDE